MLSIAPAMLTIGVLNVGRVAIEPAQARDTSRDQAAIRTLEQEWLEARDAATLDRILAQDFLHPVTGGDVLTKDQHIAWVVGHPRPESTKVSFESLRVRLYGTVAIANGIVIARAPGQSPQRTVFTDVFVWRDQRWQAVNAQENPVGTR